MRTPAIQLSGLRKAFGPVEAVAGIDLEIADGEFFSMLGPSGSGKTTVLRMIAGFELPTDGTIELAGVDVTRRAPFERDVNTVFQDYALFPHMTVAENVEYGLRVKGAKRKDRRAQHGEELAVGDVEVDTVDRDHVTAAEHLAQAAQPDGGAAALGGLLRHRHLLARAVPPHGGTRAPGAGS